MTARTLIPLWVCPDCYFAYREGDYTKTDEHDRQPWGLFDLQDGSPTIHSQVFDGLMPEEHCDGCDFHASNGDEPCNWDRECEWDDFSRSACDACGSTLAGTRYGMSQEVSA